MKPLARTAYYCCGIRMLDADLPQPVCGDGYAKMFMSGEGRAILEQFKHMARANALNVARPRIIDDLLRQALRANPHTSIVLLGAGFDSRAYRMEGGIWVELDDPEVIAFKNARLPASACKNSLRRIPIEFVTESLEEKLEPFASDQPVIIVIEGVLMYLSADAIRHTLDSLQQIFPQHRLICDLMSRRFFDQYAQPIHQIIKSLGARFSFTSHKPDQLFTAHGYRKVTSVSIARKAVEYRSLKIPKILLNVLMPTFRKGYSVHVFEKMAR